MYNHAPCVFTTPYACMILYCDLCVSVGRRETRFVGAEQPELRMGGECESER